MTISEVQEASKHPAYTLWIWGGMAALLISAGIGLGMLIHRYTSPPSGPESRLWIEELPQGVVTKPGIGVSTTTPTQKAPSQGSVSKVSTKPSAGTAAPKDASAVHESGEVVAAKSGSVYYLPNCGGAKRIKEENKVWYATQAAAAAAGYTPAKNCKGL